jgi:hypothetical protein
MKLSQQMMKYGKCLKHKIKLNHGFEGLMKRKIIYP